jgi:hypothetical protein
MSRELLSILWPIGDLHWRNYLFYRRGLTVESGR